MPAWRAMAQQVPLEDGLTAAPFTSLFTLSILWQQDLGPSGPKKRLSDRPPELAQIWVKECGTTGMEPGVAGR
jgi:hypothetical protein